MEELPVDEEKRKLALVKKLLNIPDNTSPPVPKEPIEEEHMIVTRWKPRPIQPPEELVAELAYGLWEDGVSQDPETNWFQARHDLMMTSPSELHTSRNAYQLWKDEKFSENAEENWHEARRRILGGHVWRNQFLRMKIMMSCDNPTLLLGIYPTSPIMQKEVMKIIIFLCNSYWRRSGFPGEVQIVIDQKRGRVHCTPKQGFHPCDIFDMLE